MEAIGQLLSQLGMGVGRPQFVNPYSPGMQAPDVMNAYKINQDAKNNAYNAQVGAQNSQNGAFAQMGAAALMSPKGTFSGLMPTASSGYPAMSGPGAFDATGSAGLGLGAEGVQGAEMGGYGATLPAMEGAGAFDSAGSYGLGMGVGDAALGAGAAGAGDAALGAGAADAVGTAATAAEGSSWIDAILTILAML